MAGFNHFGVLGQALRAECARVVTDTASDLKRNIADRAPVKTGFLRDSVYAITTQGSDYQGGKDALPEIDRPAEDTTAYVSVAASYGIFLELGTRFQPAQPYFYPGVERTRPQFEARVAAIEATLRGVR